MHRSSNDTVGGAAGLIVLILIIALHLSGAIGICAWCPRGKHDNNTFLGSELHDWKGQRLCGKHFEQAQFYARKGDR